MKTRPILFSAPMVRALLGGTKTQTRRIVKPQPERVADSTILQYKGGLYQPEKLPENSNIFKHCPYGQPGEKLWVRETWYCDDFRVQQGPYLEVDGARDLTVYFADNPRPYEAEQPVWRPSIHMPRWASRITLEITSVRVERLQDISEEDARAEGITDGGCTNCGEPEAKCKCDFPMPDARDSYCHLWGQINGPDSWSANPWVWCVSFRVLDAALQVKP